VKSIDRWTIRMLVSGVLVFGTLPAWGQGENPPDFHESAATSGQGAALVDQTYKGGVEQQVEALHRERWQAALKDDAGFFEKQLANQYFGVGADGRLRTKAETVQNFRSGAIKYEAIDERDVKVNTYGSDAAIVHSMASVRATIQGKSVKGDYRATCVYVKEGGNWREASFQLTPAAKAS